jgi:hypothetical protein
MEGKREGGREGGGREGMSERGGRGVKDDKWLHYKAPLHSSVKPVFRGTHSVSLHY